jgi:hypothetical protein
MARKIDSRKMLDRAIQYWKIYCIINEHNKTIFQIWDGLHLKCTFRRCVDLRIFNLWDEVVSLAAAITLFNDEDSMIWRTVPVIRGLLISIPIWGDQLQGCGPGLYTYCVEVDRLPRVHFFL